MTKLSHQGYSVGHPWYYFLGGDVPKLKEIKASACASGYEGYLADEIKSLATKAEPQRTRAVKKMREKLIADLHEDISIFRSCVRELRRYREENPEPVSSSSAENHMSMSLKHNHIYNGFANLKTLDALPEQQLELFG